jgi:hypothetical protein
MTPAGRMTMQMGGAFTELAKGARNWMPLSAVRFRRVSYPAAKAEMAQLYTIRAPTVSRIVVAHRTGPA